MTISIAIRLDATDRNILTKMKPVTPVTIAIFPGNFVRIQERRTRKQIPVHRDGWKILRMRVGQENRDVVYIL